MEAVVTTKSGAAAVPKPTTMDGADAVPLVQAADRPHVPGSNVVVGGLHAAGSKAADVSDEPERGMAAARGRRELCDAPPFAQKGPWAMVQLQPFSRWFTTIGFIILVLSSALSLNYLYGTGGIAAGHLLTCFAAMILGVNAMALGTYLKGSAGSHSNGTARIYLEQAAAFARPNLPVMAAFSFSASAAAAGIILNSSGNPAICFGFYALFIATIAAIVIIVLRGKK